MDEKKLFPVWEWAKGICAVIVTIVASLKFYSTPTTLTVDFPTLLSLLLALFSVALSALFYFKATDTSNAFYDNTYKFTKDIAELLVKIESGFGERLKHLDEGYSSMRNYLQGGMPNRKTEVEQTQQKVESEKQEIEKVRAERDEIVQRLIEQSALQQEDKDRITQELKRKEEELAESQIELSRLNRHLTLERVKRRKERISDPDSGFVDFTKNVVFKKMGLDTMRRYPSSIILAKFDSAVDDLPRGYIDDLESRGYFENGLNDSGIEFFRELQKTMHS